MAKKSALLLGAACIYHTAEEHRTVTKKAPVGEEPAEVVGSIHHPSQVDFAGLVSAQYDDGTFGITIFPPRGGPSTFIDSAEQGDKPGQFELVGS